MKVRAWTETRETRTIVTDEGPMVVRKGDIVMIVVAPSWDEARAAMVPPQPERK